MKTIIRIFQTSMARLAMWEPIPDERLLIYAGWWHVSGSVSGLLRYPVWIESERHQLKIKRNNRILIIRNPDVMAIDASSVNLHVATEGVFTCSLQTKYRCVFFLIFCWPCISLRIPANNQLHALFHVFISSLYMFRASQCSSSGDQIVLTFRHRNFLLNFSTLCI